MEGRRRAALHRDDGNDALRRAPHPLILVAIVKPAKAAIDPSHSPGDSDAMITTGIAVGRPGPAEIAPYYFTYIDKVPGDDVMGVLAAQLDEVPAFLSGISEERSLYRYAPDKWSLREVLGHVNDTERTMLFRAFWFARGFDTPLPSFDEKTAAAASGAHAVPWARHVEEFRAVRLASRAFFRNLPAEAWSRSGIASGNPFSVRGLAYVVAGHAAHHVGVIREKYS